MRVAILDDIHHACEGTRGVRRLRERAEVRIFTGSFGSPAALGGFDALVANCERTRFTRQLFEELPDLRIIAQTGNHAYHVDLAAAEELGVIVAMPQADFLPARRNSRSASRSRSCVGFPPWVRKLSAVHGRRR
jgi:phosphoglycerate dehydrogenase-like enzyme